jgi:imidazolonepropionase-like amidohydrolase
VNVIFTNVNVFDATGKAPYPGEVRVEGNRITAVAKGTGQLSTGGIPTVDGGGLTLMPGLVEGHAHLSFTGVSSLTEIGEMPPEEHTLQTAYNAKLLLDSGFTSAYSAAACKIRLDVVVRNEINAGRIPGPRIRAASPEITVTGGLGDERLLHLHRESFSIVVDGPDELTRTARLCAREGCDNIKLNISGDEFNGAAGGDRSVMTPAEIKAAVDTAHAFGRRVSAHTRASDSVKLALRHGVDVLYHCEWVDDEAIDMLEEAKDRIFIGPAIGLIWNTIHEAESYGFTPEVLDRMRYPETLESAQKVYRILRERGVRIVPGGDYGFAWTPHGTNARDIEHFVKLFDFSPTEALLSATKIGGELMGMEVGQVRDGYLADLLLVRGNPVEDVRILQDRNNLAMVMKDGAVHSTDLPALAGVSAV